MTRPDDEVPPFAPLADYAAPDAPTIRLLQRLGNRALRAFRSGERRAVEDDRLRQAPHGAIGRFTAHPDCSLLARELDRTLSDWASAAASDADAPEITLDTLRLVVIPPGDEHDLLETWARRHGHTLLDPPPRDVLAARRTAGPPDLEGSGVLVVPRLERWFLRHRHGLDSVRVLLAALAATERHCVIGCNSWAWPFLRRAVGAELLLPEPLVFAPFDAERLRRWFVMLGEAAGTREATFRDARAGHDVLALGEDGELVSDYLQGLAAHSRGIPWVAWQLWRRSLRTMRADTAADVGGDGSSGEGIHGDAGEDIGREAKGVGGDGGGAEDVFWLAHPDDYALPPGHERAARFVLHALVLHGALDVEELALVLPLAGEPDVVPALVRAGFVERIERRLRLVPAAYPTVFESLSTAGFPTPRV